MAVMLLYIDMLIKKNYQKISKCIGVLIEIIALGIVDNNFVLEFLHLCIRQ